MKMKKVADGLRYEDKYIVTRSQIELLKCRIEGICCQDDFADNRGSYNIRSLYFDDYAGNSYRDNENGTDPRSKFRIRIYNCSDDKIFLENKIKIGGKIRKDRAVVTREFCERLLENRGEGIIPDENEPINRFLIAWETRMLRPRLMIEYDREPYICQEAGVRITFDKNISFSGDVKNFFKENILMQPVMEAGKELLEVKYQEFLPHYIYQMMNQANLQRSTFSKFYICESCRRKGGYAI